MQRNFIFMLLLLAVTSWAPRTQAEVTVVFENPSQYTDLNLDDSKMEAVRKHLMGELEKQLQTLGKSHLPASQTLEITIHDIDMAGEYEPWRAPSLTHTRIIRDIYRPRIDLSYSLRNKRGEELNRGRESLTDLNYLRKLNVAAYPPDDTLRYEKALLREWFQKTFAEQQ